jgi:hypothetical protein
MSDFLKCRDDAELSWEVRELGVHFVDAYHDRLLSKTHESVFQSFMCSVR